MQTIWKSKPSGTFIDDEVTGIGILGIVDDAVVRPSRTDTGPAGQPASLLPMPELSSLAADVSDSGAASGTGGGAASGTGGDAASGMGGAAAAAPALTADQSNSVAFISGIAANGTVAATSYWTWKPDSSPATYNGTSSVHKWQGGVAGSSGGTVYYYFNPASNWSAAEQKSFSSGLALWSAVANIAFVQTASSATANLTFTRGAANTGAVTNASWNIPSGAGTVGGSVLDRTTSAQISIDTTNDSWSQLGSFTYRGGYGVDTVIHEEGHVLGLGHGGDYNADNVLPYNPSVQQFDATDTRLWSVMSYVEPQDTSAKYYGSYSAMLTSWNGRDPTTWMPLDILAAQRLYGVATSGPLSGGQVFGFHTNISSTISSFFDFTINTTPIVTLYDTGQYNTLDLSGFSAASIVNLNPGTFSSAAGLTNNIAIAFNTAIDTFIGGAGDDVVTLNYDGDTIDGGGGTNKAILAGTAAQYKIAKSAASVVTVIDTVSGRNGTSTLNNVRYAQFIDKTVDLQSLHTITFSENPLYTINPVYTYADNTIKILGEIVSDSAQPNTPVAATNTSYLGPVYASFLNPVTHVEFDAGYFDNLGSSTIQFLGANGSVLSSQVNTGYGVLHYAYDSAAGISGFSVNNTAYDGNGFSVDTITTYGTLAPTVKKASVSITPYSAAKPNALTGTSSYTFTVTRSGDISAAESVSYGVIGTGANPLTPSDVPAGMLPAGTVAFVAGQAAATISVAVSGARSSVAKTFGVTLLAAAQTTGIGTATASGTVLPAFQADDFTADGKADVLRQNDSGAIAIDVQSNLAATRSVQAGNPGAAWHIVASAEFNGDGQPDLLLQNKNGQVVAYQMSGTGISAGNVLGSPGSNWHVRGTGDFDGDGKADILLQETGGGMVVWTTTGITVTGGVYIGNPGADWTIEGVADFDGDGQQDIVLQNTAKQIVIYTMRGTGIAAGSFVGSPGAGWAVAGTGDYNHDGRADIVLHHDSGQNVVWTMNGGVVTGTSSLGNPGASYTGVVTGLDFNNDGLTDLAVQNTNGMLVGYTLNAGGGITGGGVLANPGAGWHAIGNNPVEYLDGSVSGAGATLTGTPGIDQFDFTSILPGPHYIGQFNPAQDTVALSKAQFPSYAAMQASEAAYGGGTFIGFGTTSALVIQGVTPDKLSAGNFVFV